MDNGGQERLRSALGMTITVPARPDLDPIQKAEQDLLRTNALNIEDSSFEQFYGQNASTALVRPTLDPVQLTLLTHQNNTLLQCIAVMEVNVDGTGYEIERADGEVLTEADETVIDGLKEFFDQPYPNVSFLKIRRDLRRDQETTGNAYMEVIRNVGGEIVFLNRLEAKLTRLVKLDEPVPVTTKIVRNGTENSVVLYKAERRFAQLAGNKVVYFKEFGATRDLNRNTGEWANFGSLPADQRATEVICFGVTPDVTTMYCVPRWVNNIPSVLGSRKAEELNLQFFDSGGIPPAMIFIQGGELSKESRDALTKYLAGAAKYKNRAVIAEVFSTSGSLDSTGSVKVNVERFGSEKQDDSLFENYDARCTERVRCCFRIPPLFLGKSEEYNFATALASYMVAEAQVFRPERDEFDEVINNMIMTSMAPEYVFRSKPMTVNDVETQLKAIGMATSHVDSDSLIDTLNEVANLNMIKSEKSDKEMEVDDVELNAKLFQLNESMKPKTVEVEVDDNGKIIKMEGALTVNEVAHMWADHLMGVKVYPKEAVENMQGVIDALSSSVRALFHESVGMMTVGFHAHDAQGVGELLGCAVRHVKD